jgi:hypothetical protein
MTDRHYARGEAMTSWVVVNAQGQYVCGDGVDSWSDRPMIFGGDEPSVRGYYSHLIDAGCTLREATAEEIADYRRPTP